MTKSRDQHLANDGKPKRILALDGGGLRGILSVGFLHEIERLLRARHRGAADFRLCDYFDLIAGTSTGAIIAAALAKGMSVEEIATEYLKLGNNVFEKSWFRQGLVRAKYDEEKLAKELRRVYGAGTTLGGPELRTGFLAVLKRLDTGSPWPVSNNPKGQFYGGTDDGRIGNGDYPLWQVVRASAAAPVYFKREEITIARAKGKESEKGQFVDGGVSPFNNPALQALMYATMDGYRLGWPMGAERLLLVSIGTGAADPAVKAKSLAAQEGIAALASLMDDSATLQEVMLQWMSNSPTARRINIEIGDLSKDLLAPQALISYARYNVSLRKQAVAQIAPELAGTDIESLSKMDAPENMDLLQRLGKLAAARMVSEAHFPRQFDLAAD